MSHAQAGVLIRVSGEKQFEVHLPDCERPFVEETLLNAMALAKGFFQDMHGHVGKIRFEIESSGPFSIYAKVHEEENTVKAFARGQEIVRGCFACS